MDSPELDRFRKGEPWKALVLSIEYPPPLVTGLEPPPIPGPTSTGGHARDSL